MTYTLDESHTSRNYTPAASVPAVFGYPRTIEYITIHHWGANGQNFDIVRDYLCTNTTPTSAHFVAMDGQVACIVSPLDAAWHAGNARGNAQSIGIECHPEATDGDYQTIGELVAWLRTQYGDVPLVPHNYWTSTACPGDYDLNRIDAIARGTTVTAQASSITPITQDWTDMATQAEVQQAVHDGIMEAIGPALAGTRLGAGGRNLFDQGNEALALLGQLPAAVWGVRVGNGNAAGVLAHIDAQSGAAVDVPALAAALAPHLNAASADQLVAAIRSITFAAK
jgi:hypothetical protein